MCRATLAATMICFHFLTSRLGTLSFYHPTVKTKYTHNHILVHFNTSGLTDTDLPPHNVENKRNQKVRILLPIKAGFQCFVA